MKPDTQDSKLTAVLKTGEVALSSCQGLEKPTNMYTDYSHATL